MKKRNLIILIVILLLIGGISLAAANLYRSATTPAILYIDSGEVEVDLGSGWETAENEISLAREDKVRTLEGEATIVFYESEVLSLEPHTEVSIETLLDDNIQLHQETGETWSRVSKLTGTRDYEIETPTTVATIRGTAFNLKINGEQDTVLVGEGKVKLLSKRNNQEQELVEFEKAKVNQKEIIKSKISPQELEMIKGKVKKDIQILKKVREREINKKKFVLNRIKGIYDLSDGEIEEHLRKADLGEYDIDATAANLPIKPQNVQKTIKLTKKIMDLNQKIKEMEINKRIPPKPPLSSSGFQ